MRLGPSSRLSTGLCRGSGREMDVAGQSALLPREGEKEGGGGRGGQRVRGSGVSSDGAVSKEWADQVWR